MGILVVEVVEKALSIVLLVCVKYNYQQVLRKGNGWLNRRNQRGK